MSEIPQMVSHCCSAAVRQRLQLGFNAAPILLSLRVVGRMKYANVTERLTGLCVHQGQEY